MSSPNHQIESAINFGTAQHATALTVNFLAVIDERMAGVVRHEEFGIAALDAAIPRGLHQDHLVIIGARPGIGKTTLGQQIAENVAEQGKTVLFYSIEMPSPQVVERSIVRRTGLSIESLQHPQQMTEEEWGRLPIDKLSSPSRMYPISESENAESFALNGASTSRDCSGSPALSMTDSHLCRSRLGGSMGTLPMIFT